MNLYEKVLELAPDYGQRGGEPTEAWGIRTLGYFKICCDVFNYLIEKGRCTRKELWS